MPNYIEKKDQLYVDCYNYYVFKSTFYLAWCKDPQRLIDFVRLNHDGPPDEISGNVDNIGGTCYAIRSRGIIIPVISLPFEYNGSPEQLEIIVHECAHAVFTFFKNKEIPLPKDGSHEINDEEPFCYTIGWLMSLVIESMKNKEKHKFKFNKERLHEKPKRKTTTRSKSNR